MLIPAGSNYAFAGDTGPGGFGLVVDSGSGVAIYPGAGIKLL